MGEHTYEKYHPERLAAISCYQNDFHTLPVKIRKDIDYPEVKSGYANRKYGYNIKSQLLKLLVIFPAASALAAWICTLF